MGLVGALFLTGCEMGQWMGFSKPAPPVVDRNEAYVDARTALFQLAQDKDPATQANAIEALSTTLGSDVGEVYQQGLSDPSPLVRFASAMAIGDVKYEPAKQILQRMVKDREDEPVRAEPDKRVFCALIYALHELGDDSMTGQLAPLLYDSEPEVRSQAAMAMGKMGEPSAINPLKNVLVNEQNEAAKIQITESLAVLGDSRSAEVLEAYTKGYFLDLRLAAIPAMANTRSPRAQRVLKELTVAREPARVRVMAAGEMAKMGYADPAMFEYCVEALRNPEATLKKSAKSSRRAADSDAGSLKQLAALAIGWYGSDEALAALQPILRTGKGPVRVAAAASTLRIVKRSGPSAWPAMTPEVPQSQAGPTTAPAGPTTSRVSVEKPEFRTAGGKD